LNPGDLARHVDIRVPQGDWVFARAKSEEADPVTPTPVPWW
jgi:hypothetical protein